MKKFSQLNEGFDLGQVHKDLSGMMKKHDAMSHGNNVNYHADPSDEVHVEHILKMHGYEKVTHRQDRSKMDTKMYAKETPYIRHTATFHHKDGNFHYMTTASHTARD